MSSHHIVRDDQEPALIIANGASCNIELLGQLLEWSPLVIVLDSAMERVLELGIKVDVLLGDFDRGFDPNYYKEKQDKIKEIKANRTISKKKKNRMLDAASKSGDIDEEDNKVIELVLKGVNIILMKTANTVDSDLNRVLDQQIDILFRLTHHKVFRI